VVSASWDPQKLGMLRIKNSSTVSPNQKFHLTEEGIPQLCTDSAARKAFDGKRQRVFCNSECEKKQKQCKTIKSTWQNRT